MATSDWDSEARQAALTYVKRRERSEHPAGHFDRKRRWYPAEGETRECRRSIRRPSAAYPFSLMLHCRTIVHVATLFRVTVRELKEKIPEVMLKRCSGSNHD